jgi:hypothetical protein
MQEFSSGLLPTWNIVFHGKPLLFFFSLCGDFCHITTDAEKNQTNFDNFCALFISRLSAVLSGMGNMGCHDGHNSQIMCTYTIVMQKVARIDKLARHIFEQWNKNRTCWVEFFFNIPMMATFLSQILWSFHWKMHKNSTHWVRIAKNQFPLFLFSSRYGWLMRKIANQKVTCVLLLGEFIFNFYGGVGNTFWFGKYHFPKQM